MSNIVSAEEAVSYIQSDDQVYVHSVAAFPQLLIDALVARKNELKNVCLYHLHTEGRATYTEPEYEGHFKLKSFFVGANVRKATQSYRADYIPVFLSEVPKLFREDVIKLDVALFQISPPDAHGYCSLGTSVDASIAVIEKAKLKIAQVNSKMPRTLGDSCIHVSHFDYLVKHDSDIPEIAEAPISSSVISPPQASPLRLTVKSLPETSSSSSLSHETLIVNRKSNNRLKLIFLIVINQKLH